MWASGNGGQNFDSCAADGYSSCLYTISVGSASRDGTQAFYDEDCSGKMATTFSYSSKQPEVVSVCLAVFLVCMCISNKDCMIVHNINDTTFEMCYPPTICSHLTPFLHEITSPNLPVTPVQLMRPVVVILPGG